MAERPTASSGAADSVSWQEYRSLCVDDWTRFYDLPPPRDAVGPEVPPVDLDEVRGAIRALRRGLYRRITLTPQQRLAIDFASRYKTWFDAFALQMLGEGNRYRDVADIIRMRGDIGEARAEDQ